MDIKELQRWLNKHGYYNGPIDGLVGTMTKQGIAKAQEYLQGLGLYKGAVDGKFGKQSQEAYDKYKSGERQFSKQGTTFNIFDLDSVGRAFDQLKSKGIKKVNINGKSIDVNSKDAKSQFQQGARDMANGESSTWWDQNKSDFKGLRDVEKGSNGGGPSYDPNDLDHLVMRMAYDQYHGTPVDKNQYGIEYNYSPGLLSTGLGMIAGNTINLKIDPNKYTPEQAEQIARGAGMKTYKYGKEKKQVNLFAGGKYKDEAEMEAAIKQLVDAGDLNGAQKIYNDEMARQYNTYGIDKNMLIDKTPGQWNMLFGVVPYGYNSPAISAIALGKQAVANPDNPVQESSGTLTRHVGYKVTDEYPDGRFKYNNYNEWYQGRMLGNWDYQGPQKSGATRLVTSSYMTGFPVDKKMRSELSNNGARPNANDIDRTNYYNITNPDKGTSKMQPWVYNDVARNPQAAYKYFQYIYGDRNAQGKATKASRKHFKELDPAMLNKLANAAGFKTMWHEKSGAGSFVDPRDKSLGANYAFGHHDPWEAMLDFYQNAFDQDGNLKSDFKYAENGYNKGFDGGAYTVTIKNGRPLRAEDYWNVDMGGIGAHLNAGINDKGIYLINRFDQNVPQSRHGGLLKYISAKQQGGGLKGGKRNGDSAGTYQCAQWSNSLLRDNGYGVSGNAWNLNNVDTVFNGYEGLKKPKEYSTSSVVDYNRAAADSVFRNFDSKALDKEKPYVVNMFYMGSPAQKDAFEHGKGVTGTHTGILTYDNGKWMVTHNIHGTVYSEPFLALQNKNNGYAVTAIYSPKKPGVFSKMRRMIGGFLGDFISK